MVKQVVWGALLTTALVGSTLAGARVYQSFADVAEKAIPGVVNIRTTSYKTGHDGVSDLYQFFLQGRIPRSQSSHSVGSGVVVDKEGRIVTNHHVVAGADRIEVVLAKSKKKLTAKIIGSDIKTDLALLQVKSARGLVPPRGEEHCRPGPQRSAAGHHPPAHKNKRGTAC